MKRINNGIIPVANILYGIIKIIILIYLFHNKYFTNAALIASVFILIAAVDYFFYRYMAYLKLSSSVSDMKDALGTMTSADTEKDTIRKIDGDKVSLQFYSELESIKEILLKKENNKQELLNIVSSIANNIELDKMLEDLIPKLLDVTKSNCCAFYLVNPANNKLEIKRSIGFSKNIFSEFDIALGEGFVGNAANQKDVVVYNDIPTDSVYIMRTFLGKLKPKSILISPVYNQDQLLGMLVFASIYDYPPEIKEMLSLVQHYVGVAVSNGIIYDKTKRLTNEMKFQNKLIQNLNEDLESKINERTLFLNSIMDSIKDYAIYAMDKKGVVMMWNKGAELLFGYKSEDVIGKPMEFIYSNWDEHEASLVRYRIESVLRDGRYVENGLRYNTEGKKYYYEMTLFTMLNEKDEVIGITNITQDITHIKSAESALFIESEIINKIMEGSSRALLLTDETGVILLANNNARLLLGMELLNGEYIFDFFNDWDKDFPNMEKQFSLKSDGDIVNISVNVVSDGKSSLSNGKMLIYLYKPGPSF